MNNRPIGIFDSGLGGLTAMRELRRILPNENIIYFGDTGRMPYGGRPAAEIRRIAVQNIDFVEKHGVKAILAACGTISSNAQDILSDCGTRTVGVLMPGVRELALTGKNKLAVIATGTSIKSGAFTREIHKLVPDAAVTAVACPDFVPMIEAGHTDKSDPVVRDTVARTLEPVKAAGSEALLLGCTHYGIIAEAIAEYLPGVLLIGAADAAARELAADLRSADALCSEHTYDSFYTSGSIEDFVSLAPLMLGSALDSEVSYVPPMPTEENV